MNFKTLLITLSLGTMLFAGFSLTTKPQPVYACGSNSSTLFGIPQWHRYLECDSSGGIDNGIELNQVWLIGMALLEAILHVGGIAAMVFVLWGGIKYIMSQGSPEGTASARKTIINSMVGLVILISASVLVTFVINLFDIGTGATSATALQLPNPGTNPTTIGNVLKFVYALSAVVAVIYIVIGSIKYATSIGDSSKANSARNTILYAVIGLVIVLVAQLITAAVLDRVGAIPLDSFSLVLRSLL